MTTTNETTGTTSVRELRHLLFHVHSDMTVGDLRHLLFEMADQDGRKSPADLEHMLTQLSAIVTRGTPAATAVRQYEAVMAEQRAKREEAEREQEAAERARREQEAAAHRRAAQDEAARKHVKRAARSGS